ncbi:MAG: hypothetical protein QOI77_1553 [Blastocatellia bacterium]|jgi:hypothetical protein|nr:hypothetical protein [Blastocatellia bacterium]
MRRCWERARLVRMLCNAEFFALRAQCGRDVRAPINTGPGESKNKSWTARDRTIRISRPENLTLEW